MYQEYFNTMLPWILHYYFVSMEQDILLHMVWKFHNGILCVQTERNKCGDNHIEMFTFYWFSSLIHRYLGPIFLKKLKSRNQTLLG